MRAQLSAAISPSPKPRTPLPGGVNEVALSEFTAPLMQMPRQGGQSTHVWLPRLTRPPEADRLDNHLHLSPRRPIRIPARSPEKYGAIKCDTSKNLIRAHLTKHAARFTKKVMEYVRACIRDAAGCRGRVCPRSDFQEPSKKDVYRCPMASCGYKIPHGRNPEQRLTGHCSSLPKDRFTYFSTFPT